MRKDISGEVVRVANAACVLVCGYSLPVGFTAGVIRGSLGAGP